MWASYGEIRRGEPVDGVENYDFRPNLVTITYKQKVIMVQSGSISSPSPMHWGRGRGMG